MGDETTVLDEAAARHLLRRTGFGALPKDLTAFTGLRRGDAADTLLGFQPKGFQPSGSDFDTGHNKWVKYMITTRSPLQEKLTLFWHDHFATGFSKVQDIKLMGLQNKTIRLNCKGDMRVLVKAMNRDPAMIEWLDTVRNHKDVPNENYGRELQELFTLGVDDLQGNPNYTQTDVTQIARAFTGWSYDRTRATFDPDDHDTIAEFPERGGGTKELYASTGHFASPPSFGQPEGQSEIDQVIDIIFQHRDTDTKNTVARRTTRRLLEYFCHGGWSAPDATMIGIIDDELIAPSQFDQTFVIQDLLRAVFVHDVFYQTDPRVAQVPSIKWPVDFLVSTLRLVGMKLKGRDQLLKGGSYLRALDHLTNMGQVLLDPPSVFGWDWENSWISSATLLGRYTFSRDLASSRDGGGKFKPEKLVDLSLTDPGDIVDAVTGVLGMTDSIDPGDRDVLIDYLGGPGATLDLDDFQTRDEKLRGLFALVLESPAYQAH